MLHKFSQVNRLTSPIFFFLSNHHIPLEHGEYNIRKTSQEIFNYPKWQYLISSMIYDVHNYLTPSLKLLYSNFKRESYLLSGKWHMSLFY